MTRLMLKLFLAILLSNNILNASSTNEAITDYLEDIYDNNPRIVSIDVEVVEKISIPKVKNWNAYIVKIKALVKAKPKNQAVNQKIIVFSDGSLVTQELSNLKTKQNLKDLVAPSFKKEYYKKENLIYGKANAKHKVAIFSDPLCPYCRSFVPKAIKYMKKYPNKFAVYYYHLPLKAIHPASVALVKAAVVEQLRGTKDVVLKLYEVEVDAREKSINKILATFNSKFGVKIRKNDISSKKVMKHYNFDIKLAETLMVGGTPTIYFDGKLDKTKKKYEKVK